MQEFLTAKQAAHYLSSSTSTLAKLRIYGGGPAFMRLGRAIRYRRSELDEFMEARKVTLVQGVQSTTPQRVRR